MKKLWKKLTAGIFVFALILSAMSMISTEGSKVNAADESAAYYVQSYTGTEVSTYKNADTAPVPTPAEGSEEYNDWIFAGWFTNEACSSALGKTIDAETTYYAKYVPSEVLSVKAQVTADTTAESTKSDMRLVATVDDLDYKKVGFEIYYNGATTPIVVSTTTVYSRIEAAKDGVEYGFSPNIFDLQSEYFVTATLKNIAQANFSKGFYIKPFWVTLDGTTSYGVSRYARVEDSYLNIVNVPVRVVSDATTATTGTINVAYDTTYFTYADTYGTASTPGYANGEVFDSVTVDGTTTAGTVAITGTAEAAQKVNGEVAHLRLQVKDGVTLPKKNVFTVTSSDLTTGVVVTNSVYNYFRIATAYDSTLGPDTDWYDYREEGQTEFVITTPEELYGLASLVNDKKITTETVYLGSNIVVNAGTPEGADGVWGTGDDDWSTVAQTNWTPIAKQGTTKFSGTFDGQGHTISGIYASGDYVGVGLFGEIADGAFVKNFKLTDSYFTGTKSGVAALCGWYAGGTIEGIYTDAYVKATKDHAGGLVMGSNANSTIRNCWFAGQVDAAKYVGGISGFIPSTDITIESCLNTGTINGTGQVGGILGRVAAPITVSDTLSTGTVTVNTSTTSGAIAGWVGTVGSSVGSVTCTNVYSNSSKLYYTLQTTSNTFAGAETVTDLTGMDGYTNTELDFENYWVIRETDTPVLKTWVESGALYTPDTEWAGSGTEKDPWIIKTASELYGLANNVDAGTTYEGKYFKLGANITVNSGTASRWEVEAPKYNWVTIGENGKSFKGSFDGANYTVKGLYTPGGAISGMFVNPQGCTIKNLKLTNSYLKGNEGTGGVAGWYSGGTFDTIYSDAIVKSETTAGAKANHGGGLFALLNGATTTVNNCWFDGEVYGKQFVGGITSITNAAGIRITNCLNTGIVSSSTEEAGGITGRVGASVTIEDCLNTGTITATKKESGGIIGQIYSGTVTANRVYMLSTSNSVAVGNGTASGSIDSVANLTGGNGYLNTYLTFDRHEETLPESEQHDGVWVARAGDVPALKAFADADDVMELTNQNTYRGDTRWYDGNEDDTSYTIDTAEELVGLEDLTNEGTSFEGKVIYLGADIAINAGKASDWYAGSGEAKLYNWIPIGNGDSIKFSGTFDGQGHTITGLYAEHKANGIGLFGRVAEGSTVQDFKITNSYISGNSGVGSVCGWYAHGTYDTIYSEAIVHSSATSGGHYGGMLGLLGVNATIRNCWFAGTIKTNFGYTGGIVGSVLGQANTTIESCLSTGNITGTYDIGGIVGRVTTACTIRDSFSKATLKSSTGSGWLGHIAGRIQNTEVNCDRVYVLGNNVTLFKPDGTGTMTGTYASVADLTGGNAFLNTWLTFDRPELAEPTTGYWVAVADSTPVLKSFLGDAERVSLDGEYLYRVDTRWYDETKAGSETIGDATYATYTIDTAEELIGFASLVDDANLFENTIVYLGADIVVNTGNAADWAAGTAVSGLYEWNPIGDFVDNGDYTEAFIGIFDGQGHSISGLYTLRDGSGVANWAAGLFEKIDGSAEVKNVKVLNSYFQCLHYGGVVGTHNGSNIENVYTDAIIKTTSSSGGGIAGAAYSGTIKNCQFDGMLTNNGQYTGGITGVANGVTSIENCLITGSVITKYASNNQYMGGIAGIIQTNTIIKDCLCDLKELNPNKAYCSGSVAGFVNSGLTITSSNVYVIDGIYDKVLGIKTSATSTAFSTDPTVCTDLDNYKGYMNTELDFDNIWVAMEETTPRLQVFAPADGRFDTTSWYTKAVADGDGNAAGTESNPYIIDSLSDLYGFTKRVKDGNTFESQYIKLTKSITANEGNPTDGGWATEAPYYVWSPIGGNPNVFEGNFDGGMNTISGLYATSSYGEKNKTWYTGLFGYASGATIKNIRVEDSYFYAANYSGSVAGVIEDGTVSGIYSNSVISGGDHAGGIVGNMSSTADSKCYVKSSWFNGEVTGAQFVGGIADFSSGSGENYIQHCLNTGTVAATTQEAGGVVGRVAAVTFIEDCLGEGTVTSANTDRGSIVGWTEAGSLTMNSVYGYSESGITNGATKVSGGTKSGITSSGGTKITALTAVYDTAAYNKLSSEYWTARVDVFPIPSVFAEAGSYATAAAKGNTYAIDTDLAGTGTDADPYLITSAAELYGFAVLSQTNNYSGKVVALANDITVNTATIDKDNTEAVYYDWYPIGNETVPFAGTFKGNGYTISGLHKAWESSTPNVGLFARTADTSKLSDFCITNTYFHYDVNSDSAKIGSVVGHAYGTIENIYSDATLLSYGRGTGGIIGYSSTDGNAISITNCWFNGSVHGLKPGSSPYIGGIAGLISAPNATISHCLVSGDVLGLDKRVGGLVGSVNNGTLTMTDCLFSGDITGGYTVNTGDYAGYEYVGQLIGSVEASSTGTTVTVNSSYGVNDYAPYDIGTKVVYNVTETTENEDGTTTTTVVDTIHPTVNGRGYVSKQYDRLIGYAGTTASLDFTNYWALAKEGTPVLKYFADSADIYDGSQIDALLELDYWNSTNVALSKAEEKGQGTYMLTISGSSLTAYNEYLAALDAGIFDAYGNDQSSDLNTEGVYNAIYTSANCGDSTNDDWVVNVTYVDGTIYISIATGQPLSQHLKADSITAYAAEDGYTTSGLTPTFHMLEEKYYSASSYVIQLSNGHLIVIDGGINSEAPYLFEYMQSLVPEGKKPIIEAWVLSHGHYDHVGAMMGIVQNASEYADKVYLEGIYYNEASEVVLADYVPADDPHHQYMGYIEKITSVFKTTQNKEADIYRMYTGQRYTFDGVIMDVMMAQELITSSDYASGSDGRGGVFNETSTWTMFTINGKKLLTAGDAAEGAKAHIVDMYSTSYLTVDVFTALHHGKNINRTLYSSTSNDAFSKALTVNKVVLYPFTEDLTVESTLVGEYVTWRNKAFLNKMTNLGVATTYADGSTGTAKYFYYGQGTSVLTFGDTITAEVLEHNDWDVTN